MQPQHSKNKVKLLISTSTLPVSDSDPVPAFVKEQAIHLKKLDPDLTILIHAPHNHYSRTATFESVKQYYREVRFHYFWPFRFELLTGRGILPALRANRLLYGQVPFLVVFQFFSLWALARKEKPDLLYAHWFTPQAITVAFVSMLTKIPFVFTTHASDVSVLARLPFAKKLVQLVCGQAEAYSAVSERTAEKLQMFFVEQEWIDRYSKKLEIIPMGIELNSLSTNRTFKRQIASSTSPDNRQVVLFLGRLAEKKGVAYLLDAISLLPDTNLDNLHFLIAGDGPLRENLEKKAKTLRLSNVTFTGYVLGQEKEDVLSLAKYVCIPSIIDSSGDSEGLPVVLMEGLAAGKVILASKVSGAEQFLENGETGFLFDQKSPESLRDAIADALSRSENEIEEISMKSRELAKQFGWEDITKRYYWLLKGAIANEV